MKYSEAGNWVVRVVKVDAEGYPDTLSRQTYPTEQAANLRLIELSRSLGINEAPERQGRPLRELRNPLAGEVWVATESWSLDWENRFADWVRTSVDTRFLKRNGVATDCADVAVALRWIFSRMMGLPAGNRINPVGGLLTNRSVRAAWKDLPTAEKWTNDRRFRAALNYVLENTYTHSLAEDAYPIEISSDWIKEGAFHLELREIDGHARIFTKISHSPGVWPMTDMWSTVPRKARTLTVEPFTVFVQPPLGRGGVVRHRWVALAESEAELVPPEKMPGYSLEQYLPDFFKHGGSDYSGEIAARLQESLDPLIAIRAILKNLRQAFVDRQTLVEKGSKICAVEDCSPGSANYENWGTPARDARIGQMFDQLSAARDILHGDDLARAMALLESEKQKTLVRVSGTKLSHQVLSAVWAARKYSSDPRDSAARRWGI